MSTNVKSVGRPVDRTKSPKKLDGPTVKLSRPQKDKPKAGAKKEVEAPKTDAEIKAEKVKSRQAKKPTDKDGKDDHHHHHKHHHHHHHHKHKKKSKEAKKPEKRERKKKSKGLFSCFGSSEEVVLKDPRALEAAEALGLKPWHLRKLKDKFEEIDIDGSGSIDSVELFEAVGEARSPFTDALFALIDLDGSGTIEFDEYIRVLATYCMFTKDEILRFCFELFDKDGSGAIDEKEFIELCKTINNASPMYPGNFKKALEDFDVNDDGLIDYNEFIELEKRYPLILFPAFKLQDALQRASLGESTWLRIIEDYNKLKRIEEYKATHGGKLPPDPLFTRIGKLFCPCFYHERVHVKLGAQMEARHREQQKNMAK